MTAQTSALGTSVPSFTLSDQDGRPVSLTSFAGQWVVLFFYPKDDTPGCTREACDFTAGLPTFRGLDAVVIGCSEDSPESHRRFIARYGLGVTLLCDPEHRLMAAWGAWRSDPTGAAQVVRSTVIVDPRGRVAAHWPEVTVEGHAAAVEDTLRRLQRGDEVSGASSAASVG